MLNLDKLFSKELPESIHEDMSDWLDNSSFMDALRNNQNIYVKEQKWAMPIGVEFNDIVAKISEHHIFTREHYAYMFFDFGYGTAKIYNNIVTIEIKCPKLEYIKDFFSKIDQFMSRSECTINWYYKSNHGISSSSQPLRYRKAYDSFYPQLDMPLYDYFKSYNESDACILVLIGPPGTGKTSFIENLLYYTKSDAAVTYDNKVMEDDNFFIEYMGGDSKFLVMEDSDNFIQSRKDGNDIMHKFLNVSDGLVASKHKKIIFSTNLPSVNSVDEALIRRGRCFDVLSFRKMNRSEAETASKDIGIELTQSGDSFLLTDLFNQKEVKTFQKKVGF